MRMGFVEGKVAEEKMFGEEVFPKTLVPSADSGGLKNRLDLAEQIRADSEYLSATLQRHGAVLFRGFDVQSALDFERAVEAFGWDPRAHVGATTRTKVSDRVFTANEAPEHLLINFHHEMALMKGPPSKIFFYCEEAAPEGGETSIIKSDVIVKRMEERHPEVVAKLAEDGIVFSLRTANDAQEGDPTMVLNKTWKWLLKTDDQSEALKRAQNMTSCSSIKFYSDGSADLIFGPMNPIKEIGGKRVWFTTLLEYTENSNDTKRAYGDGSAFSSEALDTFTKILNENCVDIKWQKGDVLMIDNFVVQHARKPGKPPRRVLVSLCK